MKDKKLFIKAGLTKTTPLDTTMVGGSSYRSVYGGSIKIDDANLRNVIVDF
ncbi:hypothetical protein I2483_12260 [Sporosarcina sp. E16_3]|uniref:hypothetical protein n=1 Tax=Sporosarcina sp. E16_3 TaxID=2789293 RepID=UPI001A914029|nr:hypothetical protein [Sporosarcina sp. E16_3]MBO0602432.1 hypothetical protein [Sporosarcina sp. E16_3]